MKDTIPLIRAASLAPHVKWLERRGRSVYRTLAAAGVPGDPISEPENLIPLRSALAFLRDAAESEALPELGWRVVSETSVADLGRLGLLALSERTPADALARASRAMARFCSHERLEFVEGPVYGVVSVCFTMDIDPAALHQAQLYTLALIHALCALTGKAGRVPFGSVELPPHPVVGLSHLPAPLCAVTTASPNATMLAAIGCAALQKPLCRRPSGPAADLSTEAWEILRGAEPGFARVIRDIVTTMLANGSPSAEQLARGVGMNLRALQRRLTAEGTNLRTLLEDARRSLALERISQGSDPMGEISAGLGYSNPASLSRAVKRWTDHSPSAIRREANRTDQ